MLRQQWLNLEHGALINYLLIVYMLTIVNSLALLVSWIYCIAHHMNMKVCLIFTLVSGVGVNLLKPGLYHLLKCEQMRAMSYMIKK